jgi:non-lysosomal glucosylceramidase
MPPDIDKSTNWDRREFLKISAAIILGLAFSRLPVMAGPFTRADFESLVPADKKLKPEWVKSLFERGTPEVFRGSDLKFIGMPVGGIGAGQLYLGGDGRLWHWDIFNQTISTGSAHYASPLVPASPLGQKFSLKIGQEARSLDASGFSKIGFRGEYPIGTVEFADPAVPLAVKLEAFSPFIPLNTDDSSLPATILQFTLRNTSASPVEATLSGQLENGVCMNNRWVDGLLRNRVVRQPGLTALLCSAEKAEPLPTRRPDIVFEDWDRETYDGWTVEGAAFGTGPIKKSDIPSYQGDVGGDTARVVNTHASAPGSSVEERDRAVGTLTSREFTIERNFIAFWIGGGRARSGSRLGLTLVVDGKPVHSASGKDNNQMSREHFDVRALAGKTARLEIIDDATGGWGNVGVGRIVFSDQLAGAGPLEELADFGTMALALLGDAAEESSGDETAPFSEKLSGALGRKVTLAPGQTALATFVLAWHFPNLSLHSPLQKAGRYYATKFPSAHNVAQYVADNFDRLAGGTRLWRDTWYDSTLPYWFLDRAFLNTSILATSTSFRFANGRYYGWEGVGCCEGTCGHVYQYAHAAARLFPELERGTREKVDFGTSLQPDGAIHFRGEFNDFPAIDAQAGTILRALREHQMSGDSAFLNRTWPRIKLAMQWLIAKDGNGDGLIESNQHNTLDTDWFGPVSWLSGLYLAALAAAAQMADEAGDAEFSRQCRGILEPGQKNLVAQLFDGEYFIDKVDPKHLDAINSGTGCEIDQVFGQSWAFQVGLPRIFPKKETLSALNSLWRYNFSPDVGPYRAIYKPGRWYAMAGEAGLLMCTFPRNGWDYAQAKGKGPEWAAGYFNECMNGFEYQAAGHMIWEGLTMEGLAVARAVHDRYHASRRNPWNEVECGDHYARSMASYGVFMAACGFEYHGPKGYMAFDPRVGPEDFRGAFTSAEGWGTFMQKTTGKKKVATLEIKWGNLRLATFALGAKVAPPSVRAQVDGKKVAVTKRFENGKLFMTFASDLHLAKGQQLRVTMS